MEDAFLVYIPGVIGVDIVFFRNLCIQIEPTHIIAFILC